MRRILLIVPFALITGLVVFVIQTNPETKGTINTSAENSVLGGGSELITLDTPHFSATYDASFVLKSRTEKDNNPILGQYLLASSQKASQTQIGITVARLEGSINTASPVTLRELKASTYSIAELPLAVRNAVIFEKKDTTEYEIAVIWANGNRYSSVVGSGETAQSRDIRNEVQYIVNNWEWR